MSLKKLRNIGFELEEFTIRALIFTLLFASVLTNKSVAQNKSNHVLFLKKNTSKLLVVERSSETVTVSECTRYYRAGSSMIYRETCEQTFKFNRSLMDHIVVQDKHELQTMTLSEFRESIANSSQGTPRGLSTYRTTNPAARGQRLVGTSAGAVFSMVFGIVVDVYVSKRNKNTATKLVSILLGDAPSATVKSSDFEFINSYLMGVEKQVREII